MGRKMKENDHTAFCLCRDLVGEQIHMTTMKKTMKHDHEEDDQQGPQHLTKTHDIPFVGNSSLLIDLL